MKANVIVSGPNMYVTSVFEVSSKEAAQQELENKFVGLTVEIVGFSDETIDVGDTLVIKGNRVVITGYLRVNGKKNWTVKDEHGNKYSILVDQLQETIATGKTIVIKKG